MNLPRPVEPVVRWVLLAGLACSGGCFDESDPLESDGDGANATDTTDTTGDGASTGGESPDDTGSSDTTGAEQTVLFDVFQSACGGDMRRRAAHTGPMGAETDLSCTEPTSVGAISSLATAQTPNGDGERAVIFAMPAQPEAYIFISNVSGMTLDGAQDPRFVAELDCLAASEGQYDWQVFDTELGDRMPTPAQTGTFTCGDARASLDVPLSDGADRVIGFRVLTSDATQRGAVLLDAAVVATPAP